MTATDSAVTALADGIDTASPADVPALIAAFRVADDRRRARLALLLGLVAESGSDGVTAVREGIVDYLDVWRDSTPNEPLSLALLYLLGHFPDDRDRILAVAGRLSLDRDDLSRLDRALASLDPARPMIGRVFPSPAVWTDSVHDFDRTYLDRLSAEEIEEGWDCDTRTVLGHQGAKAYWAVRNGRPVDLPTVPVPPPAAEVPDAGLELFGDRLRAIRCPRCHESVAGHTCGVELPVSGGVLNLLTDERHRGDLRYHLTEVPTMGYFYESFVRPAFLRLSGANWGGAVTPADEDRYLAEHVSPVDGPVLDLACGAGRWTSVLADTVGEDRVIALDMYPPMLAATRARLPRVPAVMAGARELPFHDASLAAAVCWNALQAFPDDAPAAIAEVGRCLKPGGTFTFLTFQMPDDPVERHFRTSHFLAGHSRGLRLFELAEVREWLDRAGLSVVDQWLPGTFVFMTAVRPG